MALSWPAALEPFDRVDTAYGSRRDPCEHTRAWGFDEDCAVFLEFAHDGTVQHIWLGLGGPGAADFIVLDPAATPLITRRMARAETLSERLFVMMMLGDDRAIAATYLLGEPAWLRT